MEQEEINKILDKHKRWLNHEPDGHCANLYNKDLQHANLQCANLRGAHLRGANLRGADLLDTNLSSADIRVALLSGVSIESVISDENTAFFEL